MSGVLRVTVHHEGAGAPTDQPRGAAGGYSAWIGPTLYTMLRPPAESFATFGYNHVSFDLCLSGDRMVYPITDAELELVAAACADARTRGWLDPAAITYPHGTIYPPPAPYPSGSSPTQCPGTETIAVWPTLVAHTEQAPAPPSRSDMPLDKDVVSAYSSADGAWTLQYDGGIETVRGPFYGSYWSLPAADRNDPTRRFLTICAPLDGSAHGYSIVSLGGEPYNFTTKLG